MKKITLLSMAIFMIAGAYAQQFTQGPSFKNNFHANDAKVVDTLMAPVFYSTQACADTTTYYSIGTGYLTGNAIFSGQSIAEVGQGFYTNGTVSEVFALTTRISGTTSSITANIYNTTAGGFVPTGAALGSSDAIVISNISNTEFQFVKFTFATPVAVTGNFVASVVLPTTTGDTVIIGGTRLGCVVAGQDDRAVFKLGSTWMTYNSVTSTQGGSIDLAIIAVVDGASGISENENSFKVFPNPAHDMFVISAKEKINTIRVFDVFGQLVYQNETSMDNTAAVNTESLSNGAYFITIETSKGTSTQRLMISK
jgi:hypothetical protein